jgi:hypothetical protein
MSLRRSLLTLLPLLALTTSPLLQAQTAPTAPRQEKTRNPIGEFYIGYSYLTSAFNRSTQPPVHGGGLNGLDTSLTIHAYHDLSADVEMVGEYGTNNYQTQHSLFFLGGARYSHQFGRKTPFVHALGGFAGLNNDAIGNGLVSNYAAAYEAGGGLDTAFSSRVAWRVEADLLHTRFTPTQSSIQGLTTNFGKFSTGLVFTF